MFDFSSWFQQFIELCRKFLADLQQLSSVDANKRLETLTQKLEKGTNEIKTAQEAYKKAVEQYLQQFPLEFSDDPENNLREYRKLIVWAMNSNDKTLISKFGITELPQHLTWIQTPYKFCILDKKILCWLTSIM